jgi:deoxycytidylate deaminase
MCKIDKFVDLAISEAQKSYLEVRVGALLIYQNKIISKGYNRSKRGFIKNYSSPL